MKRHPKWLVGGGLIAVLLVLSSTLGAAGATTFSARPGRLSSLHPSRSGHHGTTPSYVDHVTGTAWPSNGLNIRSCAYTSCSILGTMPHNGTGTVQCYVTGQKINGNPYWDYVFSAWGDGLVADYYLYTGGNIYDQVQGCG